MPNGLFLMVLLPEQFLADPGPTPGRLMNNCSCSSVGPRVVRYSKNSYHGRAFILRIFCTTLLSCANMTLGQDL